MDLNRNFGKIESDGKSITYAPTCLWPSLKPATADELKEAGWLEIRVSTPSPAEGYQLADTRYEARDGAIYGVYTYAPIPPAIRAWTPLSIKRACGDKWLMFKSALDTNALDEFMMAQELREDDATFAAVYQAACAQFGKDVVDAILDSAEVIR